MFALVRLPRLIHPSPYSRYVNSRWMNQSDIFRSRTIKYSYSNVADSFHNSLDSPNSWIRHWPSIEENSVPDRGDSQVNLTCVAQIREKRRESSAIERIVFHLQNITIDNEDDEVEFLPSGEHASVTKNDGLEDFLRRNWAGPDKIHDASQNAAANLDHGGTRSIHSKNGERRRNVVPFLAELALGAEELRRLILLGKTITEIITVPKAGLTHTVMEKIYDRWRKEELVKLKFHDALTRRMNMARRLVESRTGGWVVRLSGAFMVVFRGTKFEEISKGNADPGSNSSTSLTPLNVNTSMSAEKSEYDRILDGLGPRFIEWWGTGVLPVDGDLLSPTIPGYTPPFRVLPVGKRRAVSDEELQNLRKLSKSMPSHFALGRNRYHHGLAAAIIKLWERSFIAKISIKQGVQNTNNKLMAEELRDLTGGTLLLRNKYYIVMYRGKDFVPATVASCLLKKTHENEDGEMEEMGKTTKFRVSTTARRRKRRRKLLRERLSAKEEPAGVSSAGCSYGRSAITDEERWMFRRMGMVMKVYFHIKRIRDLILASEKMQVCWKYREVVKLITRKNGYPHVEEMGRRLEHVSGGILVSIEPSTNGYALIYYRGKEYRRPKSNRFVSWRRKRRELW